MKSWGLRKLIFRTHLGSRDIKTKGIMLVIIYHLLPKDLLVSLETRLFKNVLVRKHLYILNINNEVTEIFTSGPMVSFRGPRKFGSYLARVKLHLIKDHLDNLNVMVSVVKSVHMLQKQKHFPVQLLSQSLKLTMTLTAMRKA